MLRLERRFEDPIVLQQETGCISIESRLISTILNTCGDYSVASLMTYVWHKVMCGYSGHVTNLSIKCDPKGL